MSAVTRYGYVEHRQLFSRHQLYILESVRRVIDEEVATLDPVTAPTIQIALRLPWIDSQPFKTLFVAGLRKASTPSRRLARMAFL